MWPAPHPLAFSRVQRTQAKGAKSRGGASVGLDQSLQVQFGWPHWQPGPWVHDASPHLQVPDLQQLAWVSLISFMASTIPR